MLVGAQIIKNGLPRQPVWEYRLAVCLFQINKISDHQEYYRSCRDPRNDQTRNGKRYYPRQLKNGEKKPFGEVENKAERSSAQNNIGEDVLKLCKYVFFVSCRVDF